MKLLLLIPDRLGQVLFALQGKTLSDKLRTYQHILTILLTDSEGIFRTYGTGLLSLLRGSNINAAAISDLASIACITAARALSTALRALVQDITASVQSILSTACSLIVDVTFTDGLSIRKEFI